MGYLLSTVWGTRCCSAHIPCKQALPPTCPPAHMPACPRTYLPDLPPACLPARPPACLPACPPACPPACQPACLPACPPACLPACLPASTPSLLPICPTALLLPNCPPALPNCPPKSRNRTLLGTPPHLTCTFILPRVAVLCSPDQECLNHSCGIPSGSPGRGRQCVCGAGDGCSMGAGKL